MSEVLQIKLSKYHSLDLVRLPKARKYRIVFAERIGIQKRAFVEISFEEALRAARFLASIGTVEPLEEPDEATPTTLPGTPRSEEAQRVTEEFERLHRDSVRELPIVPLPPDDTDE